MEKLTGKFVTCAHKERMAEGESAPLEFGTPPQTRNLGGFFQTKKRMENTMAC